METTGRRRAKPKTPASTTKPAKLRAVGGASDSRKLLGRLAKQALSQLSYGPQEASIYGLQSGSPVLAAGRHGNLGGAWIATATHCCPFSVAYTR